MIKNFIILRMYRVLRVKFITLKASIKETIFLSSLKKITKVENVTSFSDFDTNDGKGWKATPTVCVKCLNRSVQVYQNGGHLKDFECGNCGFIGSLIVDTESIEEGE